MLIFPWTSVFCNHLNSVTNNMGWECFLQFFMTCHAAKGQWCQKSSFNQQIPVQEWPTFHFSALWQRRGRQEWLGKKIAAGTLLSLKLSWAGEKKKKREKSPWKEGKNPHKRFYCLWQTPVAHINFSRKHAHMINVQYICVCIHTDTHTHRQPDILTVCVSCLVVSNFATP